MLQKLTLPQKILIYAALVLLALVILFPIYYMISISLKLPKDIYRTPSILPLNATLQNYVELFGKMNFLRNIGNSLIVAGASTLISVFISCMAAYSLVRLKYRFRDWIGKLILFTYLTPGALLFISLAVIINYLRLGNTLQGLIFVYLTFAAPLSTWLMMGYYASIPKEMEEAAMIDGCNHFQAFWKVVLPLVMPALMAASMFAVTLAWKEFIFAYIFLSKDKLYTLTIGMAQMIIGDVMPWGELWAAVLLMSITVEFLYMVGQR